jgi:hypothetical protein
MIKKRSTQRVCCPVCGRGNTVKTLGGGTHEFYRYKCENTIPEEGRSCRDRAVVWQKKRVDYMGPTEQMRCRLSKRTDLSPSSS